MATVAHYYVYSKIFFGGSKIDIHIYRSFCDH